MEQLALHFADMPPVPTAPKLPRIVVPSTAAKTNPNANGFVGLLDAASIAKRFACKVEVPETKFMLTIVGCSPKYYRTNTKVSATAIDEGLWDPVDVIAACRVATGEKPIKVLSSWLARIENPRGLDELRIARILAATGTRPYVKAQQRMRDITIHEHVTLPPGSPTDILETIIHAYRGRPRPSRWHRNQVDSTGLPMWHGKFFDRLLLLQFLALLSIQRGPKGGMETCTISWLPLAYLQTRSPAPAEILHDDDKHALDCLAERLPV